MSTEQEWNKYQASREQQKRWFIQDWVVCCLRDSFRDHGIEATEQQLEKVAKDIADDWDRLLD